MRFDFSGSEFLQKVVLKFGACKTRQQILSGKVAILCNRFWVGLRVRGIGRKTGGKVLR
jgi:hypothetical protein